jgi:hypothetical protein
MAHDVLSPAEMVNEARADDNGFFVMSSMSFAVVRSGFRFSRAVTGSHRDPGRKPGGDE